MAVMLRGPKIAPRSERVKNAFARDMRRRRYRPVPIHAGMIGFSSGPFSRSISQGGGGGGGSITDLYTLTARNWSGASRTSANSLDHRWLFQQGEVPSGSILVVTVGGTEVTSQVTQRRYFSDGSLACASVSWLHPGALSDNASATIKFGRKTGTYPSSGPKALSDIQALGIDLRITVGGTDYYLVLNNLISASTYYAEAGDLFYEIEAFGRFRQGTGASDTLHSQLQGRIYAKVLADGTYTAEGEIINGLVANTAAITTATTAYLRVGGSAVITKSSLPTLYHHTKTFLVETNNQPYWSSNATVFHIDRSQSYLINNCHLFLYASPAQIADWAGTTASNYTPGQDTGIGTTAIGDGGGNSWLGPVTFDGARGLLSNDKGAVNNVLNFAFTSGFKHNANMVRPESGRPPVLNNQTYAGLTTSEHTVGWRSAGTLSNTGGDYAGADCDSSHAPNYGQAAFISGRRIFSNILLDTTIGMLGSSDPGYRNSGGLYGLQAEAQCRSIAWLRRQYLDCWLLLGDSDPARPYLEDLVTQQLTADEASIDAQIAANPGQNALKIWRTGEGQFSEGALAMWQHDYRGEQVVRAARMNLISRSDTIYANLVTFILGRMIDGCMSSLCSTVRWGLGKTSGNTFIYSDGSFPGFPQNWGESFTGGDGSGLQTTAGIPGGGCPTSGIATQDYEGPGHKYHNIGIRMCWLGALEGITGAQAKWEYGSAYQRVSQGFADTGINSWNSTNPTWNNPPP